MTTSFVHKISFLGCFGHLNVSPLLFGERSQMVHKLDVEFLNADSFCVETALDFMLLFLIYLV